jgi:hypothetical protein
MARAGDLSDRGLLAEFDDEHALRVAVERLWADGFTALETFTPYPVVGVTDRLGPRPRGVNRAAGIGALVGASGAYLLQWYLNGYLYPLNVGGRPYHSAPAFIPITFELGVLFTAFTAFIAGSVAAGLFRLWRPVFDVEGIERASIDGFFVLVRSSDPQFDPDATRERLVRLEPRRVVMSGGPRS